MAKLDRKFVIEDIDYLRDTLNEYWEGLTAKEQRVIYNRIILSLNKLHKKFGSQI